MRNKRILSEQMIASIDVLNTLSGGTSDPEIHQIQHSKYREVRVKIPGVNPESMQVEIHNNYLMVYYLLDVHSNGQSISVPKFVYHKAIPYFIDANNIEAGYHDGFLSVQLPFNERSNGYHRKISVKHDK
jgi:HSP20 family molecular chaperone IbpA